MGRTFSRDVVQSVLDRLPETASHFGKITSGDLVKVRGERGDFTFQSAGIRDGVVSHLNLYGPVGSGRGQCRSILPDRVTKKPTRRKRQQ